MIDDLDSVEKTARTVGEAISGMSEDGAAMACIINTRTGKASLSMKCADAEDAAVVLQTLIRTFFETSKWDPDQMQIFLECMHASLEAEHDLGIAIEEDGDAEDVLVRVPRARNPKSEGAGAESPGK